MFFVRGLTSNGKEVLVNPDQVLCVGPAGLRSGKSALVLTHGKRLIVDQDTATVSQRFEDYLRDVTDPRADDDPETPDDECDPNHNPNEDLS
jgi:uncharacterized protein YlzI (FlbEa/FlbD family)